MHVAVFVVDEQLRTELETLIQNYFAGIYSVKLYKLHERHEIAQQNRQNSLI